MLYGRIRLPAFRRPGSRQNKLAVVVAASLNMMNWVIDCSFASALFLPDEASSNVRSFFEKINDEDILLVPNLWWYEITNVLVVSERRKRLSHADIIKVISLFDQFDAANRYSQ